MYSGSPVRTTSLRFQARHQRWRSGFVSCGESGDAHVSSVAAGRPRPHALSMDICLCGDTQRSSRRPTLASPLPPRADAVPRRDVGSSTWGAPPPISGPPRVQGLCEGWIVAARAGTPSRTLPSGTPGTTSTCSTSRCIWRTQGGRTPRSVTRLLSPTAARVARLHYLLDPELADPNVHSWLGGESLGMVAHECLEPHYDWLVFSTPPA